MWCNTSRWCIRVLLLWLYIAERKERVPMAHAGPFVMGPAPAPGHGAVMREAVAGALGPPACASRRDLIKVPSPGAHTLLDCNF